MKKPESSRSVAANVLFYKSRIVGSVAFALFASALVLGVARAESVDGVVDQVLSDFHYQTSLPADVAEFPDARDSKGAGKTFRPPSAMDDEAYADGSGWQFTPISLSLGGAILRIITWLAVGIAAVVFLVWVMNRVGWIRRQMRSVPQRDDATVRETPGLTPPAAPRTPEGATALAAAGRYGEAAHVLLLCALDILVERGRAPLRVSATGREVARGLQAPEPAPAAFSVMVTAAERWYFGAREPDADDYQACRHAYDRFAAAWAAAR